MFYPQERIALFIDGSNLYAAARSLGFDIDYKRLQELFASKGRLIRAFYYTALVEDQEYSPIRPLVDWLDYNGYTMVTKPTKEFTDSSGRRKIKGNMDIELAIDVMEMAEHLDHIVLFSGDGDFRRLGRGGAAQGRAGDRGLHRALAAANGRRRTAAPGRHLRRAAGPGKQYRPPGRQPSARARPRTIWMITATRTTRPDAAFPPMPVPASVAHEPPPDCAACPRLVDYRTANRAAYPAFWNKPVPAFGPLDAGLLIVGLAPGLKGANQTGRPFTGDYAGDLLYATLLKFGLAEGTYAARPDDGLRLKGCRITNAVRCVPPENKVTGAEAKACRPFLIAEIAAMPNLKTLLALGSVAHGAVLAALGVRKADYPFGHNALHDLPDGLVLADSYHCSRYNTNTGRLTTEMFEDGVRALDALSRAAARNPLGTTGPEPLT